MKRTNTAKWDEKSGRWRIDVQKNGKRRSFYSSSPGRTGQREANAKADAWLDDNIEGTNRRVKELFEEYIAEKKQTTSKSNWFKLEQYGINWVIPNIGHRKIDTITENDYQKIINSMYAQGRAKKTIMCLRSTLAEFAKYCRRVRVATLNPEFLTIPKGAPVKEKTILQRREIAILFTSTKTEFKSKEIEDPYVNAYRFQVLTGLRPGELFGLRWDDIWDDIVHVRRAINVYGEETKGKNDNAIRNFVLISAAKKVLQEQWQLTGAADASLFQPISEQKYRKRLLAYCENNNLPPITPYELRHTFVSVVKKLPEGMIKPLVGHSEDMDTLGIYAHEMCDDALETAKAVGQLFDDILQSAVNDAVK